MLLQEQAIITHRNIVHPSIVTFKYRLCNVALHKLATWMVAKGHDIDRWEQLYVAAHSAAIRSRERAVEAAKPLIEMLDEFFYLYVNDVWDVAACVPKDTPIALNADVTNVNTLLVDQHKDLITIQIMVHILYPLLEVMAKVAGGINITTKEIAAVEVFLEPSKIWRDKREVINYVFEYLQRMVMKTTDAEHSALILREDILLRARAQYWLKQLGRSPISNATNPATGLYKISQTAQGVPGKLHPFVTIVAAGTATNVANKDTSTTNTVITLAYFNGLANRSGIDINLVHARIQELENDPAQELRSWIIKTIIQYVQPRGVEIDRIPMAIQVSGCIAFALLQEWYGIATFLGSAMDVSTRQIMGYEVNSIQRVPSIGENPIMYAICYKWKTLNNELVSPHPSILQDISCLDTLK